MHRRGQRFSTLFGAIAGLLIIAACSEPSAPATHTLTVTVTGSGSGNVVSTPPGIDVAGGESEATFQVGTSVTLSATADDGFAFGGWTDGACRGTGSCTLVIGEDATINADFFDPVADVSTETFVIQSGSDDAEEFLSFVNQFYDAGGTQIGSGDLDFTWDTAFDVEVLVGLRFANVSVPRNAVVTDASIAFTRQAAGRGQVTLRFEGEASDDAPTFIDGSANENISARSRTNEFVDWSITDPWVEAPETEVTPNLSTIVNEIIQRDGWQADNALAFIITSENSDADNYRRADSFEANPDTAPVLSLTYYVPGTP